MDLFARMAIIFGLLLVATVLAAQAGAAALDPELNAELEKGATAALSTRFEPVKTHSGFSLVIPSAVVHGFAIDKEVAAQMPRKLDGSGQSVATPGVGLQYVSSGGFLLLGGIFKDCYDDLAGTLQVGQVFRWGSRTTFGYSAGLYARETPIACQTTMDRRGRQTTNCEEFDTYQMKFTTMINGEPVDLIPMPFLHFATALYKDRDIEVDLKLMTNFALNEFGFVIPF